MRGRAKQIDGKWRYGLPLGLNMGSHALLIGEMLLRREQITDFKIVKDFWYERVKGNGQPR
jgi:hypothetical protein